MNIQFSRYEHLKKVSHKKKNIIFSLEDISVRL